MLLALLVGCEVFGSGDSTGAWIDQAPACDADPYAWSDDLVSFVLAGPGNGSFNFDPADAPRTGIAGAYVKDGTFHYDVSFDGDYFLAAAAVDDGVGTAWHNGDLDVQYTLDVTDTLGESWSTGIRVERIACEQTEWTWDAKADDPVYTELSGTWTGTGFEYSVSSDEATWTGERQPDLTETVNFEANDGSDKETIVRHPDGTGDRAFRIKDNSYTYEGTQHDNFDGSFDLAYDITAGGKLACTVEAAYQYDGDGTERWECGDETFECEIDVRDSGRCTYVCDNGDEGNC